jgi:hypothetical protein
VPSTPSQGDGLSQLQRGDFARRTAKEHFVRFANQLHALALLRLTGPGAIFFAIVSVVVLDHGEELEPGHVLAPASVEAHPTEEDVSVHLW